MLSDIGSSAKYLEMERAAEDEKDGELQTEGEWHKPATCRNTKW